MYQLTRSDIYRALVKNIVYDYSTGQTTLRTLTLQQTMIQVPAQTFGMSGWYSSPRCIPAAIDWSPSTQASIQQQPVSSDPNVSLHSTNMVPTLMADFQSYMCQHTPGVWVNIIHNVAEAQRKIGLVSYLDIGIEESDNTEILRDTNKATHVRWHPARGDQYNTEVAMYRNSRASFEATAPLGKTTWRRDPTGGNPRRINIGLGGSSRQGMGASNKTTREVSKSSHNNVQSETSPLIANGTN